MPKSSKVVARVPLWPEAAYRKLLDRTAIAPDPVPDPAITLTELAASFSEERYWDWYLPGRELEEYPVCGWSHFLPLAATLASKVYFKGSGLTCKTSLLPEVYVYPSGWAIRISLQITGEHDQKTLADIVSQIFGGHSVFELGSNMLGLRPLIDRLNDGIMADLFSEGSISRKDGRVVVVTTVLDSGRKTWSRDDALTTDSEVVAKIVRPEGVRLDVTNACFEVKAANPLTNFWIVDLHGCLLWCQKFMFSINKQDHVRLECYHENTVRALMTYWQERGLLELIESHGVVPDKRIKNLAKYAWARLSEKKPPYKNRALETVWADAGLKQLLAATKTQYGS